MKRKILVAGAGHGGLVAASYLAKKGYQVEVFEKMREENLGYDWHDTMRHDTFEIAGITNVNREDYHFRKDNTFYPPSLKIGVDTKVPEEMLDIEIDRKILYKYLLDNAKENGVILNFEKEVDAPLIKDEKIIGLVVDGEELRGDLVIDSAGMYSVVLEKLPNAYGIRSEYGPNDVFTAYRAYYDLVPDKDVKREDRFHVYFKFEGVKGLAWFKITEGLADIIIGSVDPITNEKIEEVLNELRKVQPCIGERIVRGGQVGQIPLKSTFFKIVGDNYIGIGDAVSMPFPLNGSGITNSIIAAKLLAESIIEIDKEDKEYSLENLWRYQVKYFKEVGCKMLPIVMMKNFLLNISERDINFLFEKGIITANELGAGGAGQEIELTPKDIIIKVIKGFTRLPLLLRLKTVGESSRKAQALGFNIPEKFDEDALLAWEKALSKFLE